MKLKCINSGSKGNCYLLTANNGETLIIEAGVKIQSIKKALNWQIGDVVACLVSHEHKDHSESVLDLLKCGIPIYSIKEVFNSQNISLQNSLITEIVVNKAYKIGSFRVAALSVLHDVPCVAFIINHEEMGKLLFITDTMMFEYRIMGLEHIMIEANYSDEYLQESIDLGLVPAGFKKRLLTTHMELGTTIKVLNSSDLEDLHEVILVHLSSNNSNEIDFCKKVMRSTGKPTYIAKKGFEIELLR